MLSEKKWGWKRGKKKGGGPGWRKNEIVRKIRSFPQIPGGTTSKSKLWCLCLIPKQMSSIRLHYSIRGTREQCGLLSGWKQQNRGNANSRRTACDTWPAYAKGWWQPCIDLQWTICKLVLISGECLTMHACIDMRSQWTQHFGLQNVECKSKDS